MQSQFEVPMTAPSRLAPAHRGYGYQDLLVACRLVDVLLADLVEARCDEKLFNGDVFDDLTTTDLDGLRQRAQFKHTSDDDRPLSLGTFTTDGRGLRLDRLMRSMLTDREGPGAQASETIYRVLLRDQAPVDGRLSAVLVPPGTDRGPFLPGMRTTRFAFDAAGLWRQRGEDEVEPRPFAFLFEGDSALSYGDLDWCCERLVIEVDAPRASLDLTDPDAAEQLLLARVRADVGAESFPNVDRTAVDVAAAMVSAARAARQGLLDPTAEELLRRAQLRSDFGAVARSHPVDPQLEVLRPPAVQQLLTAAGECADEGGCLIVRGPPGHGKSWVSQQVLEALSDEGWLISEHYCYLGDADGERRERVMVEAIFGSLIGRLAEADPRLVHDHRPRFAADEEALVACLHRARELEPDRRVALVVDGLDHITRVRSRVGSSFDPSRSTSEALASLDLPSGTAVIVLSQPGGHLAPLQEAGASFAELEGLSENELRVLASRFGLVSREADATGDDDAHQIDDPTAAASFLAALADRSAGNALYATYLCRETLRFGSVHPDPAAVVQELPPFDGTLKNYYEHLYQSLGAEAGWVADVIALVDFAIGRAELRDIRPDAAHRVDDALEHLKPVLVERATQGGVRVYHESFARYLREPFQRDPSALSALLAKITGWLEQKGLFTDSRAFRSLLPLLAEAAEDDRVVDLVDPEFVTRAVAAGFPASAINRNLATAVGAAARLGRWPLVVRYVELARAAESYQTERFDSVLVEFAEVPAALLGPDTLAARLLDDDRLVMPARAGLQMCAAVDELGAAAPWRPYMEGFLHEVESDNTSYGEASDRAVALAWLRGRLRLAATSGSDAVGNPGAATPSGPPKEDPEDREATAALHGPISWSRVADWLQSRGLEMKGVVRVVLDTHGWQGVRRLVAELEHPADACLAIADELAEHSGLDPDAGSPADWAAKAVTHGTPPGSAARALAHGVTPDDLATADTGTDRRRLLDLTSQIQERSVRWEEGRVDAWLDACALAAHRDPVGLVAAESMIAGEGWYRCWLRFVVSLCRAEAASPAHRGSRALAALNLLADDLRPFAGDPRSCDLYSIHEVIDDTLRRAVRMLHDEEWRQGIRLLKDVSDAITTTLFGEMGGPVPPDLVLRLAVEGASRGGHDVAQQLIRDEIEDGAGRRFYSDLAEYRLLGARLALSADDRERAMELWQEACAFLTAYGWHKDITIYEVLDPLPVLIEQAPGPARLRIARAQALCERVPLHTDLKETRHAWLRWWKLLAEADPVAAVQLAAPALLRECNDPNWLLNEAIEEVWRQWHHEIDPVVAGALRLTMDSPLEATDAKQLQRLADEASPLARRLLIWLLARLDERPVSYSYTNSDELIQRDDRRVAELNAIAERADLPSSYSVRDDAPSQRCEDRWGGQRTRTLASPATSGVPDITDVFPMGSPGLVKAIRTWRARPHDASAPQWAAERFANVIGYRLLDLLAQGRGHDARSAVRSIADGSGMGERTGILRSIAEGLERHDEPQLAAFAYALAWTRTRGHGGWLTFGGETEIDSLHRATALDPATASTVVADEIEQIVATSRRGTYGITQAVVLALAVGALATPNESSTSVAFSAWDEAFAIIAARAPRVHSSDDPDTPYVSPNPDAGERLPGDLQSAFGLAAIAGLAHPGRERKRRALLATEVLLEGRPDVVAKVFPEAIRELSDPATLTWLLALLSAPVSTDEAVVEACQDVLRERATAPHLTVRALARRMITGDPPPLARSAPPGSSLLEGPPSDDLWTPRHQGRDRNGDPRGLAGLLDSVAGRRIRRAQAHLPRLRETVQAEAATVLNSDDFKARLDRQLDSFGDRLNESWPDAFLAHEEAIEEVLQSVAGGGRAALMMSGEPVASPIQWEDDLASALLDDPKIPVLVEGLRQPRPVIPPPPDATDDRWRQFDSDGAVDHELGAPETDESEGLLLLTMALEPASHLPIVDAGPYRDWVWLATHESRSLEHRDPQRKEVFVAERYRVFEVRNVGDRQALALPPVADGDLRMWGAPPDLSSPASALDTSQPLVGHDQGLKSVGDGRVGLGVPDSLLVPTPRLTGVLGLQRGGPFSFEDDNGLGLALVMWRAQYDVSDHYLARPRLEGSGIVVRPDLLTALVAMIGEERAVMRDFVMGVGEVGGDEAEPDA